MSSKVYNIPASCSFLDSIAVRFLEEYQNRPLELSDVLFLLPNRRSCQALAEAFVRHQGLAPLILPQMHPLSEAEEDELLITGFDMSSEIKNLPPAMSATERQMLLTKILMAKPADYGIEKMPAGQAASLAKELASLMDLTFNQQISFDRLKEIVPDEYATHWQETLKFLKIITAYWPSILKEEGKVDSIERKSLLLKAQIKLWQKVRPQKRIIVAGTTAAFPLMKELVKTVLDLENGLLILSNVDKYLSDEDWNMIDEVHPQYELKMLLDDLQIDRFMIPDYVPSNNVKREHLLSEVMRPAKSSDKWRQLDNKEFSVEAVDGIHMIDCPNARVEAVSIALLLREVLNAPEKTAALVTTDRSLARQVSAELARWKIDVDDSAGIPLMLTPIGVFLRQILSVVEQNFTSVALLGLLKHPLYACGDSPFEARRKARIYERFVLREKEKDGDISAEISLKEALAELSDLYRSSEVSLKSLLMAHLRAAESLARTDSKRGDQVLWKGDDGEAAAKFMADLLAQSHALGDIHPREYAGWLNVLMSSILVRRRYGAHPRLKILGPIEARLLHFDRVIIGEVSEGCWPQVAQADPWLSRPMKRDFGLPLPERSIGVQASDFVSLLSGKEVFVTRAERVQRTPMVKSRWQMRLETVLHALDVLPSSLRCYEYVAWAEYLDRAEVLKRILPPAPRPPVAVRPRQLSASAVENLMRDPYIIYAKYILKLKPLQGLDQDLTFADYGNMVHAILEAFNRSYNTVYPVDAKEKLIQMADDYFEKHSIPTEQKAFWRSNFLKMADWLTAKEEAYRKNIVRVYNEIEGQYSFEAPAGKFTITAKADRIDVTRSGTINIIDYKTGQARSLKEMKLSYAPQLPIEGLIAKKGGYKEISPASVGALMYWQLGRKETGVFDNVDEILEDTYEKIVELISLFDFESTPYLSQPHPKYAPKYSDYEQLSRVNELHFGEED